VTQFDATQRLQFQGDALSAGFYVLELLSRSLAERQSEPEIFDASVEVLRVLQTTPKLAHCLRRFEMVLLSQLGYAFDYRHDAQSGAPIELHRQYQCVPESGFVAADDSCQGIPGATLLAIDARRFDDPAVLKTARRLNQLALQPLIGDAPLISRSLYTGNPRG
jgi:DNA repair protein RecO (recombination protein O)